MATRILDTLKLARRLAAAGMPVEQADGVAEAIAEGFGEQVATKADIAELRAATKADAVELRGEIESLRRSTNAEFTAVRGEIVALGGALRNDIAALRTATVQWIVGAVLLNAAMLAGFGIATWNLPHR